MAERKRNSDRRSAHANPALAAALIGGAAAATAGAVWSARALARRNGAREAHDLSPVMQTAVTACELAHGSGAEPRRR